MPRSIQKNWLKAKKTLRRLHFRFHSHGFRTMLLLLLVLASLVLDVFLLVSEQNEQVSNHYKNQKQFEKPWEKKAASLVKGTPMEKMTPYIAKKNKRTAAFLVSVAKKESDWGKFSPRLNGRDCYNYWGYRGQFGVITPSGYTCFKNPRQAVNIVGSRFEKLIEESELETPQKMIVWKCGWDCSWDNSEAVEKWVSDVDYYFQKFY